MLTTGVPVSGQISDDAILIGTPDSVPPIEALSLPLGELGDEGYLIRKASVVGHAVTVVAANADTGLLYGAFALLRSLQTGMALAAYMTPLGLAHMMGTGHHHGPAPWVSGLGRPEWNPYYYHRADAEGIGVERTADGTDAIWQYADPVAQQFRDLDTVPDEYLLWFHHVPWV